LKPRCHETHRHRRAGPTGALLSILLGRRGYAVTVLEKRPDIRRESTDLGRSINLALMGRGARALDLAGVLPAVTGQSVPVRGRAIHKADGGIATQPLGRTSDEHVWAVPRRTLNAALLDRAAQFPDIDLRFRCEVQDLDLERNRLTVLDANTGQEQVFEADLIIGADGAASVIREKMVSAGKASFRKEFISHGYKELHLAERHARDFVPEHFHSWPRQSFMIFANPNQDGSFTLTLFLANAGDPSFSSLTSADDIHSFLTGHFGDLREASPSLVTDFLTNPVGKLGTITGGPWHCEDKLLLIGDSAHAIVPFFGQGMNCAFEDCVVLDQLIDRHGDNWANVLGSFYEMRRPNTDAVAALAMYNYEEIQSRVSDPRFGLMRQVEFELMRRYRDRYVSAHVMVMFGREPYAFARDCLPLQRQLLGDICEGVTSVDAVNWSRADGLVSSYLEAVGLLKRR
jgi:kynurenine 3-monooxygenase